MTRHNSLSESAPVREAHRLRRLAKKVGAVAIAGGILAGGAVTATQLSNLSMLSVKAGVPVCRPSNSANQCAIEDGIIELSLATKAAKILPSQVITDEKSVTTVVAFGKSAQFPKPTNPARLLGSGYIARNDKGKNIVFSAAHTVDLSDDGVNHPSFDVITNVDGARRVDPVTSTRVPENFNSENVMVGTDLSELVVPSNGWSSNIHTHGGQGVHDSSNGFANLQPLEFIEGTLPVGTIVYDEGVREPNSKTVVAAPHTPVIAPMVIAGYLADNRVLLVSPDQRSPDGWDGDSGSALVARNGGVFASEVGSYRVPDYLFTADTGLKLASMLPDLGTAGLLGFVTVNVGVLANPVTTDALNSAVPHSRELAYLP